MHVATRRTAAAPTPDRARCTRVSASSADPSYPPVAAVDGTDATWWRATQQGATLTIDLGRLTPVSRVEIRAPSTTTAYTVLASADGRRWTAIAAQCQTALATTSHPVQPAVMARYIRYAAAKAAIPEVSSLIVTSPPS